jgi:hypothetical protein
MDNVVWWAVRLLASAQFESSAGSATRRDPNIDDD